MCFQTFAALKYFVSRLNAIRDFVWVTSCFNAVTASVLADRSEPFPFSELESDSKNHVPITNQDSCKSTDTAAAAQ